MRVLTGVNSKRLQRIQSLEDLVNEFNPGNNFCVDNYYISQNCSSYSCFNFDQLLDMFLFVSKSENHYPLFSNIGYEQKSENFDSIPVELLSHFTSLIVNDENKKDNHIKNILSWNSKIAPQKLIIKDWIDYKKEKMSYSDRKIAKDMYIRAMVGHAQQGHKMYYKTPYENTTCENILETLHSYAKNKNKKYFEREEYGKRSQKAIDDIAYFIDSWFEKRVDKKGELVRQDRYMRIPKGLSEFNYFDGVVVNMLEFMRGFYFASLMDNYPIVRKQVESKYGWKMGGGECLAFNDSLLKAYGINLTDLSKLDYSGDFGFFNYLSPEKRESIFKDLGVIANSNFDWNNYDLKSDSWDVIKSDPNIIDTRIKTQFRNRYHRHVRGKGVSDDIAIMLSGLLPSTYQKASHKIKHHDVISRIIGAFYADRIDTLEKESHLLFPSGQDEFIGEYFNMKFKEHCKSKSFRNAFNILYRDDEDYNLLDMDTVIDFTAASANISRSIHSSQRYFLLEKSLEFPAKVKMPDDYYKLHPLSPEHKSFAIKEYLRYIYSFTDYEMIPMDSRTREQLIGTIVYPTTPEIYLTIDKIPLFDILSETKKRIELVSDLEKEEREYTINNFFMRNTNY
jgi:hypothetical protein